MRSSRIARHTARIFGAVAVSAVLLGGVSAVPAHAGAHGVKVVSTSTIVARGAHGV